MKILKKISTVFQKKQETIHSEPLIENPWFFCELCTKFLEFKDLIDGCKCGFCQNDLFLVSWKEYQKIKEEQF